MPREKTKVIAEFGDFQTPAQLAGDVCTLLVTKQLKPATVIEPTCGEGNFLAAARDQFSTASRFLGFDVNSEYVEQAQRRLPGCEVSVASFFDLAWPKLLDEFPEPLLVIGNPPWVTNSELGTLKSKNLPTKQNFQNLRGLDALTGKSNFDISEWMLIYLLEWLAGRNATMAMLCKTAVARKVLQYAWKRHIPLEFSEVHSIDAALHFDVAVDACLLVCGFLRNAESGEQVCQIHEELGAKANGSLGYVNGKLIADAKVYKEVMHLEGESQYRWRSGVKHDCGKVMEFRQHAGQYMNGFGEVIDIEDTFLFPMLKSSALANGKTETTDRWMLVTQSRVGEETSAIKEKSPRTWEYLSSHAESLDQRKSSIYHNRPRFSVFGVGKYTFAPWKVAISGFYKRLEFVKVGMLQGKPIVLDDTAYFVDCRSEQEADIVCSLLNSDLARRFYSAFIFWDAKRPITVSVLKLLNIQRLAEGLNQWEALKTCRRDLFKSQRSLF